MLCPIIWFDGIKREKNCCFSWDFVPFVNHVHWKNYAFVSDKFICFDFKSLPFFSLLKHFSVWKFSCSSMLQSNLYSIFFFIPSQQCIDLALLIFSGFSPNLESLQKNFRILCAGGFGNFGDIFRQKMTTFIIFILQAAEICCRVRLPNLDMRIVLNTQCQDHIFLIRSLIFYI